MKETGKNIIEKIENCTCLEDHYGRYLMSIQLPQGDSHEYFCDKKAKTAERLLGGETFYLSEEASATVKAAIGRYRVDVLKMLKWPSRKCLKDKNFKVCFKSEPCDKYTYTVCYVNRKGQEGSVIYRNSTLESMITKIYMISTVLDEKYEKTLLPALKSPTEKSIKKNPLYIAAKKAGDRKFLNILRRHYGLSEEKEGKSFMRRFRRRILPELPEEYNKNYIVSCKDLDTGLLRRSGYVIRHRPYFAMFDSTHEAWQLNPYSKLGVDAAPDDQTPISFKEYLKMFEDAE
ncbi:MAG: hypothetical protein J5590_05425 [Clostridia bacterium]|nr:hypothetical protein [Clostridia bacterium]